MDELELKRELIAAKARSRRLADNFYPLVEDMRAIAEGRTLVMDDLGETLGQALQRDARSALDRIHQL